MEYILYIGRFLYRIRWWLLIGTAIITFAVYMMTKRLGQTFNVEATLYTGVVSGYTVEGGAGGGDWINTQNAMDNLINIIQAESTLQRVFLRLYSRNLMYGNPDEDNEYITAARYRQMYEHVKNSPRGKEILALIDKKSEDKTVANLTNFFKPQKDNYLYGLFYYNSHPHYSFAALKRVQVVRKGVSDLLELNYSSDDAGITYNTIDILTEEFVNEYRLIRYGETDKVIEYFKSELDRIGGKLRSEEELLTQYNVDNRIINYIDETREIAAINKEFELREQSVLFDYNSSKSMLAELEKHMDNNSKQILNNLQFVDKLKEASTLTGRISEMETVSSDNTKGGESLQSYKDRLAKARKELSDLSDRYIEHKYTKEGIAKNSIIEQWLDLTLKVEKAKSELSIVQQSRRDLDDKYAFFAPVGSTIKQKERSINFTESNYLSVLKSYNDALLRKKNLEMTSATLKVLNPPAYPISAGPTARKKIIMGACAGSFLFILGFFLLLELLDRTLRDSIRARRLTGINVLGAFPSGSALQFRAYNKACTNIASKQLSNSILHFLTHRKEGLPYIVNFISTEASEGKSYLSEHLLEYWISIGLKVRKITNENDFKVNSRSYVLAKSIRELYTPGDEDIVIVEYPSLRDGSISQELLREASLNLLVVRANRGWGETDKLLTEHLQKQVAPAPLYLYLTRASRDVVEDYTGMLPPYTFLRKLRYRLSQLALTESLVILKNKKKHQQEEDDE